MSQKWQWRLFRPYVHYHLMVLTFLVAILTSWKGLGSVGLMFVAVISLLLQAAVFIYRRRHAESFEYRVDYDISISFQEKLGLVQHKDLYLDHPYDPGKDSVHMVVRSLGFPMCGSMIMMHFTREDPWLHATLTSLVLLGWLILALIRRWGLIDLWQNYQAHVFGLNPNDKMSMTIFRSLDWNPDL